MEAEGGLPRSSRICKLGRIRLVRTRTLFDEFEKKFGLPVRIESTKTVDGYEPVSDEDQPECLVENLEEISTNLGSRNVGAKAVHTNSDLQDMLSERNEINKNDEEHIEQSQEEVSNSISKVTNTIHLRDVWRIVSRKYKEVFWKPTPIPKYLETELEGAQERSAIAQAVILEEREGIEDVNNEHIQQVQVCGTQSVSLSPHMDNKIDINTPHNTPLRDYSKIFLRKTRKFLPRDPTIR
ncbi:unnamed protein product [Lepeophtheirus salmonis]|uniref:(salmon louse) hypothetical protein n=1 Tax=Lepeophtheirus salmonis TaxID=72036 RepID=A0A7R8CDR9_LEPSM|nr:unnamed protein product [Lepeophtheirus salmonis]CAF2783449.1 unnamed protein product [Lepeophtheirus salmonis]